MLMRDRILGYLSYIDTVWPVTYPGLTIEYGRESYGPLAIYVIVRYNGFCIKRIFNVDDIANDDDVYFNIVTNSIKTIRDEVIEKGERHGITPKPYFDYASCYRSFPSIFDKNIMPKPKKIILNDPATIILWSDNTKTIVKKNSKDKKFDPEKGIALCYMKKALGNKGNYNNVFKDWIK